MSTSLIQPKTLWEEILPGGASYSFVLKRGRTLRLTDIEGGANVPALLFNSENLLERYNMADTLKAQHTFKLTAGHALYSDMGRVLGSITKDSMGWHDTVTGLSDRQSVQSRFGQGDFQTLRNAYYKNGRDTMLVELGKWGLGKKDLVSNLNLFTRVSIESNGALSFYTNHSPAGSSVEIRADMNTLFVLCAMQHPLDPATRYAPKPVKITALNTQPASEHDLCYKHCAENRRGFENNNRYFI